MTQVALETRAAVAGDECSWRRPYRHGVNFYSQNPKPCILDPNSNPRDHRALSRNSGRAETGLLCQLLCHDGVEDARGLRFQGMSPEDRGP